MPPHLLEVLRHLCHRTLIEARGGRRAIAGAVRNSGDDVDGVGLGLGGVGLGLGGVGLRLGGIGLGLAAVAGRRALRHDAHAPLIADAHLRHAPDLALRAELCQLALRRHLVFVACERPLSSDACDRDVRLRSQRARALEHALHLAEGAVQRLGGARVHLCGGECHGLEEQHALGFAPRRLLRELAHGRGELLLVQFFLVAILVLDAVEKEAVSSAATPGGIHDEDKASNFRFLNTRVTGSPMCGEPFVMCTPPMPAWHANAQSGSNS